MLQHFIPTAFGRRGSCNRRNRRSGALCGSGRRRRFLAERGRGNAEEYNERLHRCFYIVVRSSGSVEQRGQAGKYCRKVAKKLCMNSMPVCVAASSRLLKIGTVTFTIEVSVRLCR